ncbi:hypothetical protein JOB18_037138 [Solea senegalensis]|uniref:Uncharacterized protein n=1 Tax=Solea senegalensis TaxID=28829 RepID=A0AAV6QWC1_SOLSE|nr:hypothetical protein JOB18_037138 [Solea senegalensis]
MRTVRCRNPQLIHGRAQCGVNTTTASSAPAVSSCVAVKREAKQKTPAERARTPEHQQEKTPAREKHQQEKTPVHQQERTPARENTRENTSKRKHQQESTSKRKHQQEKTPARENTSIYHQQERKHQHIQ